MGLLQVVSQGIETLSISHAEPEMMIEDANGNVNSIFTEGYLTTPGATASDDHQMIRDLGFELEVHGGHAAPEPRKHLPVAAEA